MTAFIRFPFVAGGWQPFRGEEPGAPPIPIIRWNVFVARRDSGGVDIIETP
jgi:hypothetical protein